MCVGVSAQSCLSFLWPHEQTTAAAKSIQSCPTLCDPIDSSPPGPAVPGILQAITLEWIAISFSNAWKWKVKVKLLSRVRPSVTPWTAAYLCSSFHRIFQARVLERGAIAFSDEQTRAAQIFGKEDAFYRDLLFSGTSSTQPAKKNRMKEKWDQSWSLLFGQNQQLENYSIYYQAVGPQPILWQLMSFSSVPSLLPDKQWCVCVSYFFH